MRADAPRSGSPAGSSVSASSSAAASGAGAGVAAAGAPVAPFVAAGTGAGAGACVGAADTGAGAGACVGAAEAGAAGACAAAAGAVAGAAAPFPVAKKLSESSSRRSGSCSNCERISSSSHAFGPGWRSESPGVAVSVIQRVYGTSATPVAWFASAARKERRYRVRCTQLSVAFLALSNDQYRRDPCCSIWAARARSVLLHETLRSYSLQPGRSVVGRYE